jgi:hypothetical protein
MSSMSTVERVMDVYKHRQVDLCRDLSLKPYTVSRWVTSDLVPAEYILPLIRAAKLRDEHKKLPGREEMALSFLRDHQRKAKLKNNNNKG